MIKYNRNKHAVYFGNDDIIIDDITFNNVHIIPSGKWENGREADFYMHNGKNLFLLTIRCGDGNRIFITENSPHEIRYIIAETEVDNIFETLEKITVRIKEIPYTKPIPDGFCEEFSL